MNTFNTWRAGLSPWHVRPVVIRWAIVGLVSVALSARVFGADGTSAPQDPVGRYPAGSIQTVETADQAIRDVDEARKRNDAAYAEAQRQCYKKFVSSSCLDDARQIHRDQDGKLRAIEVEANRYKRNAHATEVSTRRANEAREREANAPADAQSRAENRRKFENKQHDAAQNDESRKIQAGGDAARAEAFQQKSDAAQKEAATRAAQSASDAAQRQRNVKAYEAKQAEAADRRERTERKRAEKDRERAAKEKRPQPMVTPAAPAPAALQPGVPSGT